MFMTLRESIRRGTANFARDEDGAGAVEMIMIIAVVIIVAIIFREHLINLVKNLMGKAETEADGMFNYNTSQHYPK